MHSTHLTSRRAPWALAIALLFAATSVQAIDVDAGDYTALPEGTNAALLYVQHAQRNSLYAGGNKLPGGNGLDSDIGILRLIHFMKLGDYIVDPQVLLPFGRLKGTGDLSAPLGQGSGTADAIFAATVWTINDPVNKRYLGITPFIIAPTGSYNASQALNLGENRWKYALQVGYIQGMSERLTLDLAVDATAHGKNDDAGGQVLKQSVSSQLQAFGRYAMSPTWDLRAGLSWAHSGETSLNGVAQGNASTVSKLQLGTAVFVGPGTQLLATVGQDLKVNNGFKESARVNLRLLQLF